MIKSYFSIDTIYGEAITKYMKKCKSKPVSSCKEVARTGELAASQNSSKLNKDGKSLFDDFFYDMPILGKKMTKSNLPIQYPLGNPFSIPLHLKPNGRDYYLIEYAKNYRFVYRLHCNSDGCYSAMVLDSNGNIGFIPSHLLLRLYQRAFLAGLIIYPDQLIPIIVQNFVYMTMEKGSVDKYILNEVGVVPTVNINGLNLIDSEHLVYVLLTFMPKEFINDKKQERYLLENQKYRP